MSNSSRRNKKAKPGSDGVDATLTRQGGLSYLEIPAADVRQSAIFYEIVCGWKIEERDTNDFRFAELSGQLIGRFVTGRAIARKPGWLPFIYVHHIEKAVEQVGKFGGEVAKSPYPEGNLLVAIIRDPTGNMLGLWEQAAHH
jgi:uncharacterized protein